MYAIKTESFCENWVLQLDHDDRLSLVAYNLKVHNIIGKGAKLVGKLWLVGQSEQFMIGGVDSLKMNSLCPTASRSNISALEFFLER